MTSSPDSIASSPSPSEEEAPLFPKFTKLPPELRHEIWRLAIPTPGINFFNLHCIPNDHPNCNRSTSPSWLYLDLRRLSIDDDDSTVAEYDPSAWQARSALGAVCRESRAVSTPAKADAATITLTRPTRGLFVRAGDGQLARLVPSHSARPRPDQTRPAYSGPIPPVERVERRHVRVHRDDVLCISVENCSFNLPHEELPAINDDSDNDMNYTMGWMYDPQLMPGVPLEIPDRLRCLSMNRLTRELLKCAVEPGFQILLQRRIGLLMSDATTKRLDGPAEQYHRELNNIFWDRFGDRYVREQILSGPYQAYSNAHLTKIVPEKNDHIRLEYLRSSALRSPKRPARLSR